LFLFFPQINFLLGPFSAQAESSTFRSQLGAFALATAYASHHAPSKPTLQHIQTKEAIMSPYDLVMLVLAVISVVLAVIGVNLSRIGNRHLERLLRMRLH
jgi:hypothetical protein